ncbi:sigma-E factor regulatory protein RseB [Psychrosphaera saromensis]|uniref:MucB/RseB C-terminal domain-containing protein n=1 Tax=Psychrosphaera saromensis TaxID=716813 RepID=UPI000CF4BA69|nr:MucB/RseB C-terminal domain-containing protein [Psychrosphaera saromensis]GHB65802.1 sigma-E factor regulatory protein RseB [Psychrosphaera saromensis]GLQ14810.1 sigma-E factor regulatory protein RseB [Psychrosphaera saromensis]
MNRYSLDINHLVSVNFKKLLTLVFLSSTISFSTNVLAQSDLTLSTEQAELTANAPVAKTSVGEKVNAGVWLAKLKIALTQSNFQAGIVTMKADKTKSYNWIHGVIDAKADGEKPLEVEGISPLIGTGVSNLRHNQIVTFIEPNKEAYSIESDSIRKFIPPIFYQDINQLSESYQFVMVSKNQIGGRSAQLIRIESIDDTAYNYWVWIDVESALPLRMAFVNKKGEVIEQILMTHLSVFAEPTEEIIKLGEHTLPTPPSSLIATHQETNNWNMSWIPNSFSLIKSDRHHLSITREVSDYYLYSDGLVEFSIYVQRQLDSFNSPLVLQEGAMSFVMVRSDGFDVTVVGTIPAETAYKVASSVKSL